MSSHHFVKEGQEPALIIADIISLQVVQPFLEWAPVVIVLEPALDEVLFWGIKADVVISSISRRSVVEPKIAHQRPIELVQSPDNQHLVITALEWLSKKGQKIVNIATRDLLTDLISLNWSRFQIRPTIISTSSKWIFVSGKYEKWLPAGSVIQVIANEDLIIKEGSAVIQDGKIKILEDSSISLRSQHPFWLGEYF